MMALPFLAAACGLSLSSPDCRQNGQVQDSHPQQAASLFNSSPVADKDLAQAHGRGGFALTVGSFIQLTEVQARQDFRMLGSVPQTSMDVWWGTTGSQMIAGAVRAGTPFS